MTLKPARTEADRSGEVPVRPSRPSMPLPSRRPTLAQALPAAVALLSAGALAGCGAEEAVEPVASGQRVAAAKEAPAPRSGDQVDPTAPLPKARPKVVSPVAGESTEEAKADGRAGAIAADTAEDDLSLPKPKGPANRTSRSETDAPSVRNLSSNKATALPNGVALPPLEAPEAVMQVIRAGNTIARSPYKWGGGHGRFKDNGYDCSGSVSYALFAAGLVEGPRTSGQYETWGKPGKGRWITVYANAGHMFMEVAGIRFDTSGQSRTGSRWQNDLRPSSGYAVRHPPGL